MAFWLGIFIGGIFAFIAIKIGFYEMWATLFNIVISIYLAVFLRPMITNIAAIGDTPYNNALIILATAIVSFLILHGIAYIFLTGQFTISFPKLFDTLGTGLLGFLAGFLVWSFVSFLIGITPISQNTIVKEIGFGSQFRQTNIPYLCWWCSLVNKAVSTEDSGYTTSEAINGLLKEIEKRTTCKPIEEAKANEPNEPTFSVEENNIKNNTNKND